MAGKRQQATGNRQRARRKAVKPREPQPTLVYIGLTEKAAQAVLDAVRAIIAATKGSPHVTLEALRVLAQAVEVKNITISECTFGVIPGQHQVTSTRRKRRPSGGATAPGAKP